MRLILIGPPGSGKGTQASLLSSRLGLLHIGTGDILREAVRQETAAGKLAKPFMAAGKLVPDDVVNEIVVSRFRAKDRPDQFVMDGYPRSMIQAQRFDQVLLEQGLGLDAVVLLQVADEEIVRRLSSRQREDDSAATVLHRLKIFHEAYDGLVDYFRRRGLLVGVPGMGDLETVYANIVKTVTDKIKTDKKK